MLKLRLENNANCICGHPEVEALLVTKDSRTEIMKEVPKWLVEGVN